MLTQEYSDPDWRDEEEIQRLKNEYDEALADEQDAASRASAALEALAAMGVDYD